MQKAAAVLIALGADRASMVYKHLKEDEVEQLSLEIAKLDRLTAEDLKDTIEDFYGLCVTQKVINEGGVLYARDVLEKAFGPQQAVSFMERVTKSLRTKSFEFIRKADYKNLQMTLQNEHPQTIALVLSYARSDQAAQIIAELPRTLQLDVIKRIAELDRVSPEMINVVESTLERRFATFISADHGNKRKPIPKRVAGLRAKACFHSRHCERRASCWKNRESKRWSGRTSNSCRLRQMPSSFYLPHRQPKLLPQAHRCKILQSNCAPVF